MMSVTSTHSSPPERLGTSDRRQDHVGVRELRQNLSVYLDKVKQGTSLTVTEHGRVVALLSPLTQVLSPVERLIAEGRATPATRSLRDLRPRRAGRPDERASEAVISDMRDERL